MGWTKGSRYSQAIGTQRDLVFLPAKAAQISCNLPKLVSYSVCPLINARQLFLTLGLISVVFALCLLIEKKVMTFSNPIVTYVHLKMAYSYPNVNYSGLKVTYS